MPLPGLPCHHHGCTQRAAGSSSSCGGHDARKSIGTKVVTCAVCSAEFLIGTAARAITCSQACKRARRAAQQKAWKDENRARVSKAMRSLYDSKREELLAYQAQRRASMPDKIRVEKRHQKVERERRHRASKRLVTQRDLSRMLARANNCCTYCLEPLFEMHWDHVVPLSRGGATSKGNLAPSCPQCNMSKGAKTVMEWRLRQRRQP